MLHQRQLKHQVPKMCSALDHLSWMFEVKLVMQQVNNNISQSTYILSYVSSITEVPPMTHSTGTIAIELSV